MGVEPCGAGIKTDRRGWCAVPNTVCVCYLHPPSFYTPIISPHVQVFVQSFLCCFSVTSTLHTTIHNLLFLHTLYVRMCVCVCVHSVSVHVKALCMCVCAYSMWCTCDACTHIPVPCAVAACRSTELARGPLCRGEWPASSAPPSGRPRAEGSCPQQWTSTSWSAPSQVRLALAQ